MPGVSRDNDSAGGDLIPSQSDVYVNNELVIIDGDGVAGHGIPPHIPQTISATINTTVYVHNKLVVVAGDTADVCGEAATGSGDVFIAG